MKMMNTIRAIGISVTALYGIAVMTSIYNQCRHDEEVRKLNEEMFQNYTPREGMSRAEENNLRAKHERFVRKHNPAKYKEMRMKGIISLKPWEAEVERIQDSIASRDSLNYRNLFEGESAVKDVK